MDTWKTRCGTLWHILDSSIAAARGPTPREESLKCYCPKVRKFTQGISPLHHIVNHTFQHTFTYPRSTFKFWWHSGALGSPRQNDCLWAPGGLVPKISPREVPP